MTFPPDLRESLLRHDGVELQDGTLRLDHYGPLSGVGEIVQSAGCRQGGDDSVDEPGPGADPGEFRAAAQRADGRPADGDALPWWQGVAVPGGVVDVDRQAGVRVAADHPPAIGPR
ncbi:hypothetical protein ACFZCK_22855 [Kitasatospora purpeofusca]|uniref:hypothetical protein n=1 Tax=Kitasatospora purpeofusca TaxID=67352 RepID=UPI0036EFD593